MILLSDVCLILCLILCLLACDRRRLQQAETNDFDCDLSHPGRAAARSGAGRWVALGGVAHPRRGFRAQREGGAAGEGEEGEEEGGQGGGRGEEQEQEQEQEQEK